MSTANSDSGKRGNAPKTAPEAPQNANGVPPASGPSGQEIVKPAPESVKGAEVQKTGFGDTEISKRTETAATAVAAQARAQVEARYVMALQRPRDMDDVRIRLLKECERPGFAKVARYRKPIGAGVEGPSIRFAEAAMRLMGNLLAETTTVYDDDEKRIVRVSVTDLETNFTHPKDVVIVKRVERRQPAEGQKTFGSRINSDGKRVYLVAATDDDLLNKENALVSKALRTGALRMLPGDILEECMATVMRTQRDTAAKDPDAERKALLDGFAAQNVMPKDLKAYLGHPIEQTTPAELVELRGVWTALKEGEGTWAEVMEARGIAAEPKKAGVEGVKDALKPREPGQEG